MPAEKIRRWTTAEVRALMDESRPWPRYELIDGQLIVSPAPTLIHQWAVVQLWNRLNDYLTRVPVGIPMISPSDLELEQGQITQPDVFVVPLSPGERRPRSWPEVKTLLVAVEVLSPSNARYYRLDKRKFFQRVAVPEYWVVDLDARVIERWTPSDARPEIVDETLIWQPAGSATAFRLDLPEYFAEVHRDSEVDNPT